MGYDILKLRVLNLAWKQIDDTKRSRSISWIVIAMNLLQFLNNAETKDYCWMIVHAVCFAIFVVLAAIDTKTIRRLEREKDDIVKEYIND